MSVQPFIHVTVVDESHGFKWVIATLTWDPDTGSVGGAGGGLTDAELRASPVPVLASIDTTGLATDIGQTTGNVSLASIDTKTPALGQQLAAASSPVVLTAAQITTLTPPAAITGFATETTLGTRLSESDYDTKTGSLTEAAPASDTASSGLNGRLQRIAQRLTSLIALLPAALGAGGGLKVDGSGAALPVSGTVTTTPPANASTNIAQLAGAATSVNSGTKDAGTLRVVLATDQPQLTNKLLVTPDANSAINLAQVGGAATATAASGVQKTGVVGNAGAIFDGATAASVPANALLNGGRAATANPTSVTNGQMVGILCDKAGRIVTSKSHVRELVAHQQTNIAVNTEVTIVTAGGAGVFNDLVQLIITTAGLAAQTITIKDATAGTTRFILNYPNAAVAPGSPLVINFDPPIPQAAANANWTVTQSLATACNYTARFIKNL